MIDCRDAGPGVSLPIMKKALVLLPCLLLATCAPFLSGSHPPWWPFAIVALVIVQGGTLWALWARLLQWRPLRTRYENSARWIDGAFGIALAVLALTLLVSP